MKSKMSKIILEPSVLIVSLLILLIIVSYNTKGTKAVDSTDPSENEDVVENLASTMANEGGCGKKEYFVYQLIWGAVFMNNYSRIVGLDKPITTKSMCDVYGYGALYSSDYCYYNFDKLAEHRKSRCSSEQIKQLKLAARMVLSKSFTIPKNVYMAAEKKIIDAYGIPWISYTPSGGWTVYYAYQNTEKLATEDIYGNTVNQDEQFYKNLANCLYNHPTLFGAYNKCSDESTPDPKPTTYVVNLYPNGGTFSDGKTTAKKIEYTEKINISDLPKVEKSECKLKGWNVGSTTGPLRTQYLDKEENGENLYANWDCDDSSETEKYTVTFKLNNSSNSIYWSEIIKKNETANEPEKTPTKEGYNFIGWITSDGKDFNFNTKITSDITLYAKWDNEDSSKVEKYTVTFKLNNSSNSIYWSAIIKKNETASEPEKNPTKEGYNFIGWTTSDGKDFNFNTKITSDITLFAKWNKKEEIDNPNTGLFKTTIFLALIIPSMIGVLYYYKYYIKINDNIKS